MSFSLLLLAVFPSICHRYLSPPKFPANPGLWWAEHAGTGQLANYTNLTESEKYQQKKLPNTKFKRYTPQIPALITKYIFPTTKTSGAYSVRWSVCKQILKIWTEWRKKTAGISWSFPQRQIERIGCNTLLYFRIFSTLADRSKCSEVEWLNRGELGFNILLRNDLLCCYSCNIMKYHTAMHMMWCDVNRCKIQPTPVTYLLCVIHRIIKSEW